MGDVVGRGNQDVLLYIRVDFDDCREKILKKGEAAIIYVLGRNDDPLSPSARAEKVIRRQSRE